MSEFSNEIEGLLDELQADIKGGSAELVRYAAERRQHIAEAIAAGSPDLGSIVKTELLNIKAYAATEAVEHADKVDEVILKSIIMAFSAFDKVVLASL